MQDTDKVRNVVLALLAIMVLYAVRAITTNGMIS